MNPNYSGPPGTGGYGYGNYPQQQQPPPLGFDAAAASAYHGQGYPGQPGAAPPMMGAYPGPGGAPPPMGGGYPTQGYPTQGGPPPPGAYGGPPQPVAYGAPPQPGYGPPPASGAYGGPPQPGYGPQQGYPGQQMPTGAYGCGAPHQEYPTQGQPPAAPYGGGGYQQQPQQPPYGGGAPANAYGAPPNTGAPAPISSFQVGQLSGAMDFKRMGARGERFTPTVHKTPNFNAETDAGILRKAMKGIGTDEKALISVLGHRTSEERIQISKTFKTMYGKDLAKEIDGETSGHFREALKALTMDPVLYDAKTIKDAISGIGTKENVLTEIITTRDASELQAIKDAYHYHYKKVLEKEVMSDTSGFYRRVLVSCLQCNRNELNDQQKAMVCSQGPNSVVDRGLAQREAQELFSAGEKKFGTDEGCFIKILGLRNPFQLQATFEEFQKIANRDIFTSIDREMSGDLCYALKSMAMAQVCKPKYFAERLHGSMKGLGTSDDTLVRVIVTRCDIDLESIKEEFSRSYGKTLASYIQGDCSGDYKNLLMSLVGNN